MPDPIVLKDELAKMIRAASPAAWLRDAAPVLQEWAREMPGARQKSLLVSLRSHRDMLSLSYRGGEECWYEPKAGVLKFHRGTEEVPLATEQEFLQHLLGELRSAVKA